MGIIGLSDPTGHYEAVMFSEGLPQYRDLLEPGTAVLLFLSRRGAGRGGARPHPVGRAARCRRPPRCRRACEIFLRDRAPLEASPSGWSRRRARPRARGDGEVQHGADARSDGTEVEVKLPGRFKVSPQIAGAIKAVPGVVRSRRRFDGRDLWPCLPRVQRLFLAFAKPRRRYISRAISHADAWLSAPTMGQQGLPVRPASAAAHTDPRRINRRRRMALPDFTHASAIGSWRALRPSGPPLEPEDGSITSSAPATTSTSSISPRPCRCCIARCRR